MATLYVAKKYFVPHLARACVNYLETSLTAKNACLLLSQSRLFEEPELMQRCWEVIDAQVCEPLVNMNLAEDDDDDDDVDNDEDNDDDDDIIVVQVNDNLSSSSDSSSLTESNTDTG